MLPGHVCQHWTPSLVPRSQSQGCLMSPDSSWPRDARTARDMPGDGPKDMDTSQMMQRSGARRRRLGGGPTKTMGEVKEPSGGYPTNIMGALAMDHSALQGHDCAATLSQEMLTMFRMISDQDLAHPAWRWQCRPLHFATRQQ